MRLGNLPQASSACELNKWYIGVEITRFPPYMYGRGVFKPYVFAYFVKFTDFGGTILSEPKKKGGFFYWKCPFGIKVEMV